MTKSAEHRTSSSASTQPRTSRYLLSWMALAAFGIGYIGIASIRPDLLAGMLPLADQNAEHAYGGRNAADLADELITLRKWVNDLQHEMAATRSAVHVQAEQGKALQQRLAAAEERLPPVREARAELPPAKAAVPSRTARAPAAPAAAFSGSAHEPVEMAEAKPPLPANVKVLNQAPASEITTGSVPAPAVPAFGQAKVSPPAAPAAATQAVRGIEIADADSLDSLRSRWHALSNQHAGALKQLEPRYRISASGGGNPFTLLAGPFQSTADAAKACAQLRAGGVACKVSDYSGNGL